MPNDGSLDAITVALHDLYGQYGVCAGRLVDLVDWIEGGP